MLKELKLVNIINGILGVVMILLLKLYAEYYYGTIKYGVKTLRLT
jgi:hypothetical protein